MHTTRNTRRDDDRRDRHFTRRMQAADRSQRAARAARRQDSELKRYTKGLNRRAN